MALPSAPPSIRETRRTQVFPVLEAIEINRIRRFGEPRVYDLGDTLAQVGEISPGLMIVLSGRVEVTQHDFAGHSPPIVIHDPGAFLGELAQLSGRPSLVDARATAPTEVLVVAPNRLRALLIAEAELGERIMRALILRRVALLESGAGGPIIIGPSANGDVLRLQSFLGRNGHPYVSLDPETDADAKALIEKFHFDTGQLPVVLCPNGQMLRNPDEFQLARCIGLVGPIDPERIYDVAIVGAGPAGLATAVYGGSEGLSVLVLDGRAFGGQAGASSRIENYLGFPTGITGMALMARAYNQAQKFGVDMAIPDNVIRLEPTRDGSSDMLALKLSSTETVRARTVVIANGARYRRLALPNLDAFEGSSVHYWASPLEAKLCAAQEIALVGGGNSAGQAIVYLASKVEKIWVLVRGSGLRANMSRYLVDRIEGLPNVEVVTGVEASALEGSNGALSAVSWRRVSDGVETRRPIRHLFLFIGADANTSWLGGSGVTLDSKGFVLTGPEARATVPLETSLRGVFAVGDVRSGSVKRVAAAVGEGAQVVAALHAFLASTERQTVS